MQQAFRHAPASSVSHLADAVGEVVAGRTTVRELRATKLMAAAERLSDSVYDETHALADAAQRIVRFLLTGKDSVGSDSTGNSGFAVDRAHPGWIAAASGARRYSPMAARLLAIVDEAASATQPAVTV